MSGFPFDRRGVCDPEPPYRCRFCGAPSWLDPSDQTPPPDYCHPEDHGSPDEDPRCEAFAEAAMNAGPCPACGEAGPCDCGGKG